MSVFLLGSIVISSQEKVPGKHSVVMFDFKLPKSLANKSFKGLMSGLVNLDVCYQYNLENGLGFGAGFKYSYFELEGTAFQGVVTGQLEGYNPFFKLSKRKILNEKTYLEFSVNGGYNFLNTKSNQCLDVFKQSGGNIMPQIGYYMVSSEFLSFGIVVSYNYLWSGFSPANICMTSFPGFDPSSSIGDTQVFAVGFGFSTYLPSK